MSARVVSVNVGRPAPLDTGRRTVSSAIAKAPVEGRVALRGVNLEGDDQADRSVHGGPEQAVYAYASEDTAWWSEQLDRGRLPELEPARPDMLPKLADWYQAKGDP